MFCLVSILCSLFPLHVVNFELLRFASLSSSCTNRIPSLALKLQAFPTILVKKVSARSGGKKKNSLFSYSFRKANTIQCHKTVLANVIFKESFKTLGLQRYPGKMIFKF